MEQENTTTENIQEKPKVKKKFKVHANCINLLIQLLSVIFGILIALYIDDYKNDLNNKSYLEEVYKIIKKETNENIKDIENSMLKTTAFLKSLQNNFKSDTIILDIFSNNKGLSFPNLKNSSIYYIQKLEIKNANDGWAVISLILEINENRELLKSMQNQILTQLSVSALHNDQESKVKFAILINSYQSIVEQTLVILKKIDKLLQN